MAPGYLLDSVIYKYIENAGSACVENAFLFVVLKIGGARTPLAPLTGLSSARLMAALKID